MSAEVSSADGFDGSDCKYKYNYADGDGEEIKDGTDIAFQQIALFYRFIMASQDYLAASCRRQWLSMPGMVHGINFWSDGDSLDRRDC